jgi:hypothetical protein
LRARSVATHAAVVSSDEITTLAFATGGTLDVAAPLEQVAKQLENAARSSAGTLAWVDEAAAGDRLGVNAESHKNAKSQREAYEREREDRRRAAEQRRHAQLLNRRTP